MHHAPCTLPTTKALGATPEVVPDQMYTSRRCRGVLEGPLHLARVPHTCIGCMYIGHMAVGTASG